MMNDENNHERFETTNLERDYEMLSRLWNSGVSKYINLTSTYLIANSILVAAVAVVLTIDKNAIHYLSLALSTIGLFLSIQMGMALGASRAQNAYWKWKLWGIERLKNHSKSYSNNKFFLEWHEFRDNQKKHLIEKGEPLKLYNDELKKEDREFKPYFSIRHLHDWWARRLKDIHWLFIAIYLGFITYNVVYLI